MTARRSQAASLASRQSYAPAGFRARDSLYPVPQGDFLKSLEECVGATEACVGSISGAIDALEPGVADLPRLSTIYRNMHYYLVVPEPKINHHKALYAASLSPQIEQLIQRAETLVSAEGASVRRLEERLAMLETARLPAIPAAPARPSTFADLDERDEGETRCRLDGVDTKGASIAQARKIGLLKKKREKLEQEMARLASEAA
ncbi:hypothetical protein Q8F55_007508 [Vanrija albida]|uniref:DASH complex subunit SPC19 n=1 Tax=Vanrija albida TaxID=181172 RepID=A0ABR3PTW5_9TREE